MTNHVIILNFIKKCKNNLSQMADNNDNFKKKKFMCKSDRYSFQKG